MRPPRPIVIVAVLGLAAAISYSKLHDGKPSLAVPVEEQQTLRDAPNDSRDWSQAAKDLYLKSGTAGMQEASASALPASVLKEMDRYRKAYSEMKIGAVPADAVKAYEFPLDGKQGFVVEGKYDEYVNASLFDASGKLVATGSADSRPRDIDPAVSVENPAAQLRVSADPNLSAFFAHWFAIVYTWQDQTTFPNYSRRHTIPRDWFI